MAYIRMFQSSVDPSDVEEMRKVFEEDVKPVYEQLEGCEWIELMINVDHNAGGLVDGCTMTRWSTREHLEASLEERAVQEAIVRVRSLLRQEPVTKTYEVLE